MKCRVKRSEDTLPNKRPEMEGLSQSDSLRHIILGMVPRAEMWKF